MFDHVSTSLFFIRQTAKYINHEKLCEFDNSAKLRIFITPLYLFIIYILFLKRLKIREKKKA